MKIKATEEVRQTTNSSAYNRLARKIRWKTKRFEGSLERNKMRLRDDRHKNHRSA